MTSRRRTVPAADFLLFALMMLTGCSAQWQPLTIVQPTPLDKKVVLEFRAKNQLVRLHGVRFTQDSVSGIPWLDHLSCDTCRVSYAITDISQARTGNPGAGAWVIAGPMLVATGAFALIAFLWWLSGYKGD